MLDDLGKIAPSSNYAKIPLPFKQVAIGDYINASHTPRLLGERSSDNVVAVLYLEGEIVDGWGDTTNIGGDRFAAELRQLRKDDDVKAVVLRVNSPGGSAYASEVIQREILALKAEEAGHRLHGQLRGLGRLLGLHLRRPHLCRAEHDHRLHRRLRHVLRRAEAGQQLRRHLRRGQDGQLRRFRHRSRGPRPTQELALAQARVDDLYGKFLDKVSDSRHIPLDANDRRPIAQGRVWSGTEALDLKLVDEIGGLQQAITYAADKAKLGDALPREGISGASHLRRDAWPLLLQQPGSAAVARPRPIPLTRQFLKMKSDLKSLQEFNDPLGVYARMPLGWDIK